MTRAQPLEAERFRGELVGYCYRFFGSYPEAEDAVQETMVRAWQRSDGFDGRSSLRTWLYRIATNICLDMKRAPQRRALPMDLRAPGAVPDDLGALSTREPGAWVGPIADSHLGSASDPADAAVLRESVRLAFLAALQLLPPRQRVVLILRDVLSWSAAECADLLGMSVVSVNSALARARRTIAGHDRLARAGGSDTGCSAARNRDFGTEDAPGKKGNVTTRRGMTAAEEQVLLRHYVTAFEAYDVDRLVELLSDDAVFSMPPFELWLRGSADIERWWRGPGQVCRNSRVIVTRANGGPAAAVYHQAGPARWEPFALHVVDMRDGRICGLTHFMGPAVFAEFGLPPNIVTD